jgi:hypothetical protein
MMEIIDANDFKRESAGNFRIYYLGLAMHCRRKEGTRHDLEAPAADAPHIDYLVQK